MTPHHVDDNANIAGREPGQPIHSPLVPFLLKNAAFGFAMAVLFVAALLTLDVGGMRTLIGQSDVGLFAALLVTFMIGLTFASLQMGLAIMFKSGDMDKNRSDPSAQPGTNTD